MTTINHWAPLDFLHKLTDDGMEIFIRTDIPVHLFMRWTNETPLKHPSTQYRRGILVPFGTRFCFVAFHENEQEETGDTFTHTFIKPNWAFCETRWFYFIGTIDGETSPSASPIFKHHRVLPPYLIPMSTFNSIEPEFHTLNVKNAWTELDLSHEIHPDSTGIVFQLVNTAPGRDVSIGMRPAGSTFDQRDKISRNLLSWGMMGVGINNKLEYYVEEASLLHLWVFGYTGRQCHFFNEPIDITPAIDGAYHDIDITPHAPLAQAAIVDLAWKPLTVKIYSLRPKGSTDDFYKGGNHCWPAIRLSTDRKLQAKFDVFDAGKVKLSLIGYISAGIATSLNAVDLGAMVNSTWTMKSVDSFYPTPKWVVLQTISTAGAEVFGARKRLSYRTLTRSCGGLNHIIVHCDQDSMIELFREFPTVTFYQTLAID